MKIEMKINEISSKVLSNVKSQLSCPPLNLKRILEDIEDIQMFLLNMSFISRVKWTIFIFHEWRSHE